MWKIEPQPTGLVRNRRELRKMKFDRFHADFLADHPLNRNWCRFYRHMKTHLQVKLTFYGRPGFRLLSFKPTAYNPLLPGSSKYPQHMCTCFWLRRSLFRLERGRAMALRVQGIKYRGKVASSIIHLFTLFGPYVLPLSETSAHY